MKKSLLFRGACLAAAACLLKNALACCSLAPAHFSKTIGLTAEIQKDGQVYHLLGYQNTAVNLNARSGGNALLLPIPAVSGSMTPANILDTSSSPNLLKDMWRTVHPVTRNGSKGGHSPREPVVFNHDIYTIVLAQDVRTIGPALSKVPQDRRPAMNPAIFQSYGRWYPGWTFALCCFNVKEETAAKPMLWWYKPRNPAQLFFPALDAHDGNPPDLKAQVDVDHTLIVSSHKMARKPYATKVEYTDPKVSPELLPYRPTDVIGGDLHKRMKNGDFVAQVEEVRQGVFNPRRATPPGDH